MHNYNKMLVNNTFKKNNEKKSKINTTIATINKILFYIYYLIHTVVL